MCILAVHAVHEHVPDNFADDEALHALDHFWQLPTAGALRMLVDEESDVLSLQLLGLDREPHVSHSVLPECIPLLVSSSSCSSFVAH